MFRDRGYPDRVLRESCRNALSRDRPYLLSNTRDPFTDASIRVIGTFDAASGPVRRILMCHWNTLTVDPDLRDLVGTCPQVTFR